jgi:hypothetical protein
VRRLVDNEELRRTLGAVARHRAMERWDKDKILRYLASEMTELCNRKHAGAFLNCRYEGPM